MKIEDNIYSKSDIKTSLVRFMEDYAPVLGRDIGEYYAQKLRSLRGKRINRTIYQHAPAPIFLIQILNDVRERIVCVIKNKPRRKTLHLATPFEKNRLMYLYRIRTLLVARDICAIVYTFHGKRQNQIQQTDMNAVYHRLDKQIIAHQRMYALYEQTIRDLKHLSLLPNVIPLPKEIISTCIRPYVC